MTALDSVAVGYSLAAFAACTLSGALFIWLCVRLETKAHERKLAQMKEHANKKLKRPIVELDKL